MKYSFTDEPSYKCCIFVACHNLNESFFFFYITVPLNLKWRYIRLSTGRTNAKTSRVFKKNNFGWWLFCVLIVQNYTFLKCVYNVGCLEFFTNNTEGSLWSFSPLQALWSSLFMSWSLFWLSCARQQYNTILTCKRVPAVSHNSSDLQVANKDRTEFIEKLNLHVALYSWLAKFNLIHCSLF